MNNEFIIPVVFFIGLFTFLIYSSIEKNRTKRKMIEAGMDPYENDGSKRTDNGVSLKLGLTFLGAGIGLFLANLITNLFDVNGQEAIYFSMISIFGGLGLILAHYLARKENQEDQNKIS